MDKPRRLASRSERGHVAKLDSKRAKGRAKAGVELLAKADCEPQRFVREFRAAIEGIAVGQKLDVNLFAEIKRLDVTGTSKGRGTAGVMVRHNMAGQRATHGVKKVHRHPRLDRSVAVPRPRAQGSPHGRPARQPAAHLDGIWRLVRIDAENNLLLVDGAVPGPNGGYLVIRETNIVT